MSLPLVDIEGVTLLLREIIGKFLAIPALLGPAAAPGQSPSVPSLWPHLFQEQHLCRSRTYHIPVLVLVLFHLIKNAAFQC